MRNRLSFARGTGAEAWLRARQALKSLQLTALLVILGAVAGLLIRASMEIRLVTGLVPIVVLYVALFAWHFAVVIPAELAARADAAEQKLREVEKRRELRAKLRPLVTDRSRRWALMYEIGTLPADLATAVLRRFDAAVEALRSAGFEPEADRLEESISALVNAPPPDRNTLMQREEALISEVGTFLENME